MFLGDYKKLHGLTGAVHNLVEYKAGNIQCCKTINHLFPIMQDKITGRNNDHIRHQNDTSQSTIPVFVDNGSNNIRTTGTTVSRKCNADTATTEGSTDNTGHERLITQ